MASEVNTLNKDVALLKKHTNQLEQERHSLGKANRQLQWNIDASQTKLKILDMSITAPTPIELAKKHRTLTTSLGTLNIKLAKYEKQYMELAKKKRI